MPTRLHALMQHAHDLNEARLVGAGEDHVHWVTHRRLLALATAVPDMQTSNTPKDFAAIHRRYPLGIGCDPSKCRRQQGAIADAGFGPLHCLAGAQRRRNIRLRRTRQPIARHGSLHAAGGETVKRCVETGIIHFREFSAIQGMKPGFDLRAQEIEFQFVSLQAVLQAAHCIAHRLTGVLIHSGPHDLFDEGVLLGRQVDVPCRYIESPVRGQRIG